MIASAPIAVPATRPRSLRHAIDALGPSDWERRQTGRVAFAFRMMLTPLDGAEPILAPIYVDGRDISPAGVGFVHNEPITYRRVRLSAVDRALNELGFGELEIDVSLRWCRFLEAGKYESGGRVLRSSHPLF